MKRSKIDILKQVVRDQQYTKVKFKDSAGKSRTMLIDLFSASIILRYLQSRKDGETVAKNTSWEGLMYLSTREEKTGNYGHLFG